MSNFTFSFFKEQIVKAKRVLILTHIDPDGDAVGSSLATKNIVEKWGKEAEVIFYGNISVGLKIENAKLSPPSVDLKQYDLIIVLDTNNLHRTGAPLSQSLADLPKVIIVDHHIKKDSVAFPQNVHTFINSNATATCELIYDILEELKEEYDNKTAFYLLLGIYTDSGGFFHSNTSPALLRKVKELLKKGVLLKKVIQSAFKGKSVSVLKFWGEKITKSVFQPQLKFIYSWYRQEEIEQKNISNEEIGGLVNLLNMCQESKFSLLLSQTNDKHIKGSLRSSQKKFTDVSIISRFLGGGGHRLAAGFETEGKIVERNGNIKLK